MPNRIKLALILAAAAIAQAGAAEPVAPEGAPPPEVMFEHMPDRLHAYVWRNWNLVPTKTLADTVGATEQQIASIARSMGLPDNRPIPEKFRRQAYITIVRRNWHLLPVDQLLKLINMTPEEFAFGLREDDVLLIKLGGSKPRCEPLKYAQPSAGVSERAAEVKRVVEKHFGPLIDQPGEERFAFVAKLSAADETKRPPTAADRQLRYIYSYFGVFGDPLYDTTVDPYPDGLLQKLAEVGVNGVWMHVVLRQLAPGGPDFPEFGDGHERRLANLQKMVERAQRYGIRIYLYMNEPRAQPEAFFANRQEMAGVREGDHLAMCTSDPRVRKWISDALTHVFQKVPGLGGVFTITASENLTSCASHFQHTNCPRCSKRTEADIIAEVNAAIEQGVHRAAPEAKVLCWDWGWARHGFAPEYITKMPDQAWLMSVSEWSQPFERGGVKSAVGEYSMSVVGPGPRATQHWQLAKQRGLKTAARVSFNSTWELSSVPYLPVMDLVAEHCANLTKADVDGLMLSWSLGGYPSPNLRLAQRMMAEPQVDTNKVLDELAAELYGSRAAPEVRKAWTALSIGFREFPYALGLYTAPQQIGPANLLYRSPTGYGATMTCYPYDDLTSWSGQYPPEVLADQFRKVAVGWGEGVEHLARAVELADADKRVAAEDELRIVAAAYTYWASIVNQVHFIMARNELAKTGSAAQRARLVDALESEIPLAKELFRLSQSDSRIGFEAANHYFYMPLDLVEKVISCEYVKTLNQKP